MLRRYPKDEPFKWSKVFKGVLYVEVVLLLGSYYYYRKLCRNENYRHQCYQKKSFILEAFYNFMDLVGHDYYRKLDHEKWEKEVVQNK